MRSLVLFSLLFVVSFAHGDELMDAYQKEYAYLVAEKEAMSQRLQLQKQQQDKTLAKLRGEIGSLEQQYLNGQNAVDRLNQQIVEASRSADTVAGDSQLLQTTLLQAIDSLSALGSDIDETASPKLQLESAFQLAAKQIEADSQLSKEQDSYFLQNGEAVEAQVLNVGRVAKFGMQSGREALLYPTGNGRMGAWDPEANPNTAQLLSNNPPAQIQLFLYDDPNKAVEKREDRGFMDDLEAGGVIGKVILALGALGLLFVVIRALYLMAFSSDVKSVAGDAGAALQKKDRAAALSLFKKGKGSAHRVMAKTVENLDKDRDYIEDIISESILNERSKIDKFGAVILVFAAVSPLLGLLGTVTGMITTFDIITEFGTGDPKLLSSGISEALITTKFGLMVAIPLLLLGNVLSSWGTRIKSSLEQSALHVINTYKA